MRWLFLLLALASADASALPRGGYSANPAVLPLDQFGGAPGTCPLTAVAYGVTLQTRCYNGPALQLTRASDSHTQDIGFVNGVVDATSADAFCASTSCAVTTWYDQSGNACNATQATFVNAPAWLTSANNLNGIRPVSFNSQIFPSLGQNVTQVYMTIGGCLTWTPGQSTLVMTGQLTSSYISQGSTLLTLFEAPDQSFGFYTAGANVGFVLEGQPGAQCSIAPLANNAVHVLQWQNSTFNCASNGLSGTHSAFSARSPVTGAVIGTSVAPPDVNTSPSQSLTMDVTSVVLYRGTTTAKQYGDAQTAYAAALSIPTGLNDALIIGCDSTNMGRGTANPVVNDSYWREALPGLSTSVYFYNDAVSGRKQTGTGGANLGFPSEMAVYYTNTNFSALHKVKVVDSCGMNDLRGSVTELTIWQGYQAFANLAHGLGGNVEAWIATSVTQTNPANDPSGLYLIYQDLENNVKACGTVSQGTTSCTTGNLAGQGGLGFDGIIPLLCTTVGGMDPTCTTYQPLASIPFSSSTYSPDGLHPTKAAMGIMGAAVPPALNATGW